MKAKSVVLMSMVLMSLPGFAGADDNYIWTGAISDDWMMAGNWDVATVPSNGALGDDADAHIGSTAPLTWPVLDSGDMPSEIDDLWIGNGDGLSGELLVQGGVNLQCNDDLKICYEAGSVYAKLAVEGFGTTVVGMKSLELGEDGTVVVDVNGGKLEIGEVGKPKWNMIVAAGADSNVTYTLQLEAGDGEYSTTDTMKIVLYADACEHASNQEGFEWIDADINHDCIVDDLDLAILEQRWLESNYSVE